MSDNYEIGYGRPPKHSQFKPGQSGNPKGRPKPKNSHPITDFEDAFFKREKMVINGVTENISAFELFLKKVKQSMMKDENHYDRKLVLDILKFLQFQERYWERAQENSQYMQNVEDNDDL